MITVEPAATVDKRSRKTSMKLVQWVWWVGNVDHIPSCGYLLHCGFLFIPGCRRDQDGYYWITGRIDDMLNVSGEGQRPLSFFIGPDLSASPS